MNPLDWILGVLLTYSVVRAAMRGFIKAAFSFAGLVCGFVLACWNYRLLGTHLIGLIPSPAFAQFAAFLLILTGSMLLAGVLAALVRRTVSAVGLSFADRFAGALFGLLRGILLGVGLLLALTAFLPTAPWVQTSFLAPSFLRAAHGVSFLMPADLTARLLSGLDHLKHTAPHWIK